MASPGSIMTDRRKSTKIDTLVNAMCILFMILIAGWGFTMYSNQNRIISTQKEIVVILAELKISNETRRADVNHLRCDFDDLKIELSDRIDNIEHKVSGIYYTIFPGKVDGQDDSNPNNN